MILQTNSPTYQVRAGDTMIAIARRYGISPVRLAALNPYVNPYRLRAGDTLMLSGDAPAPDAARPAAPDAMPSAALHDQMRALWEQHAWWTRELIIGIAEGLPDQAAVTNRLLRNPAQIAALFRPAFGDQAMQAIARLFTGHLTIGAELMTATKAGDATAMSDANRRWYRNADALATEFASLGAQFSHDEMHRMLYRHLDLIRQQLAAQLAGNYEQSISIFDEFERQALMMADRFSRGIAQGKH